MQVSAPRSPVIVNCLSMEQVRPPAFVLACGDGNTFLKGMHWPTWQSAAYGTGTLWANDCVPDCAGQANLRPGDRHH